MALVRAQDEAIKEHWILLAVGVPIFFVGYIGALMSAKPDSYWVRRKQAWTGTPS